MLSFTPSRRHGPEASMSFFTRIRRDFSARSLITGTACLKRQLEGSFPAKAPDTLSPISELSMSESAWKSSIREKAPLRSPAFPDTAHISHCPSRLQFIRLHGNLLINNDTKRHGLTAPRSFFFATAPWDI